MNNLSSSLLGEIAAGKRVYKPKGTSKAEIEEFQKDADGLLKLVNSGRIRCKTHTTSRFGKNLYDRIVVQVGELK